MTEITPQEFITADYKKFDKQNGAYSVKTTSVNSLVSERYDEIQATYPTTSTEVYTYKLATVSVAVLTVTYTDDTKEVLTSVVRS